MVDGPAVLHVRVPAGLLEGVGVVDVVIRDVRYPGVPVLAPESGRGGDVGGHGGGRSLLFLNLCHTEDHPHVVGGAPATHPAVDILAVGGGDEVVVPTRSELQSARGGREAPEGDGEVHESLRLVADCNDAWPWVGHPTRFKLLALHAVDDVLLVGWSAGLVHRADEVNLVVLRGQVALVHYDGPRLGPGTGRRRVPVNVSNFVALHRGASEQGE